MFRLRRFLSDTSGSTALEYALIGSLISVAIVVGVTNVGSSMNGVYGTLETEIRPELD